MLPQHIRLFMFNEIANVVDGPSLTGAVSLAKGGEPQAIPEPLVRKSSHQTLSNVDVSVHQGLMQRGVSVLVGSINVKAMTDKNRHLVRAAVGSCLMIGSTSINVKEELVH